MLWLTDLIFHWLAWLLKCFIGCKCDRIWMTHIKLHSPVCYLRSSCHSWALVFLILSQPAMCIICKVKIKAQINCHVSLNRAHVKILIPCETAAQSFMVSWFVHCFFSPSGWGNGTLHSTVMQGGDQENPNLLWWWIVKILVEHRREVVVQCERNWLVWFEMSFCLLCPRR